uniref:YfcC family protein n=1 Tax=Pseudothermotoga hypogea TaxID=57487 RepID=A0A832ID90_9THEM
MSQKAFSFQKKIFISSFLILLSLVLLSGILTCVLPMGRFERYVVDGRVVVDFDSYRKIEAERLPIYRWFSAPIEVLFSSDGPRILALLILLLIVGGSFTLLHESGALKYTIDVLVSRYASRKNSLLLLTTFSFMVLGSALGLFEEVVPFVPIVVNLSLQMGWDEFTGLGMSILAAGFGFASATFNPFTVLLAQSLAGLPIFSGLWLRLIVFGVVYVILVLFLMSHVRKIEKSGGSFPISSNVSKEGSKKSYRVFLISLTLMLSLVVLSFFLKPIQEYLVILMVLIYFFMGILCGLAAKFGLSKTFKIFLSGLLNILPSTILILLAASVKHIVEQGMVLDTILRGSVQLLEGRGQIGVAMTIYLFVLALNFFIPSASAKAFLLIPILTPLTQLSGLSRQTMVLAWTFGDGFSNMIFPTNPVLLISLSLASYSYVRWFKKTILLQLLVFLISCGFILIAVWTNYGPF